MTPIVNMKTRSFKGQAVVLALLAATTIIGHHSLAHAGEAQAPINEANGKALYNSDIDSDEKPSLDDVKIMLQNRSCTDEGELTEQDRVMTLHEALVYLDSYEFRVAHPWSRSTKKFFGALEDVMDKVTRDNVEFFLGFDSKAADRTCEYLQEII